MPKLLCSVPDTISLRACAGCGISPTDCNLDSTDHDAQDRMRSRRKLVFRKLRQDHTKSPRPPACPKPTSNTFLDYVGHRTLLAGLFCFEYHHTAELDQRVLSNKPTYLVATCNSLFEPQFITCNRPGKSNQTSKGTTT